MISKLCWMLFVLKMVLLGTQKTKFGIQGIRVNARKSTHRFRSSNRTDKAAIEGCCKYDDGVQLHVKQVNQLKKYKSKCCYKSVSLGVFWIAQESMVIFNKSIIPLDEASGV